MMRNPCSGSEKSESSNGRICQGWAPRAWRWPISLKHLRSGGVRLDLSKIEDGHRRWASYRTGERLMSSQHNDPVLGDTVLLAIAVPSRENARLAPPKTKELIRKLCAGRDLTLAQIGSLLNRHPEGIRNRFLSEMVREGSLLARYPDPTHPDQAYRADANWRER